VRRAEHVAVEHQRTLCSPLQREFVAPALCTGFAHAPPQRAVTGQAAQRRGQRRGVARRSEHAGFTVAHDVTDAGAANVAGDHRQSGAHRLEQHQTKRLAAIDRRQAQHIRLRIQGGQRAVVDMAGEVHARIDADRARAIDQLRLAFALADQQQRRLRLERERIEQHVEALVVAQASDREHAQRSVGPVRRNRAIRRRWRLAETERDHAHLVAPRRQRRAGVEVWRRCGDHCARAPQQRLFPRPIQAIAHA